MYPSRKFPSAKINCDPPSCIAPPLPRPAVIRPGALTGVYYAFPFALLLWGAAFYITGIIRF